MKFAAEFVHIIGMLFSFLIASIVFIALIMLTSISVSKIIFISAFCSIIFTYRWEIKFSKYIN